MSAVNVLVSPQRVVILTDTKAMTEDGVQFHAKKTATFPWARMAIAVRGYIAALRVFERIISQNANNYDRAVQFLVEHFDEVLAAEYSDPAEAFAMSRDLDLYLCGWGMNGPAAVWISNYQGSRKVERITGCLISPMVGLESQTAFARDVMAGMPQLMADQAATHVAVGGWMQVTEIGENGIHAYTHGNVDELSEVASRMQPSEELEQIAAVEAANAERAEALAAQAA